MAFGDNIRERRVERGWKDQDFADRKAVRQKIWNGVKLIANVLPVPAVGAVVNMTDGTVKTIKDVKSGKANVVKVLAAAPDLLANTIESVKNDVGKPSFDQETADLLKDPIVKMALELSGRLIMEIEQRTGIDIPESVEEAIFDTVSDAMDDLYEQAEERLKGLVKKYGMKAWEWVKGIVAKKAA